MVKYAQIVCQNVEDVLLNMFVFSLKKYCVLCEVPTAVESISACDVIWAALFILPYLLVLCQTIYGADYVLLLFIALVIATY